MKSEIYELIIETTRRCNMRCAHCLRGEPENKSMSREHLYNFLRQISYVSSVTFTGGEPTLPSGIKVIYDFMDVCHNLEVCVGNFYMVTNAKVWRPQIPRVIYDLHNFCDTNENSCIDISTDIYHDTNYLQRNTFKSHLEEELLIKYRIEDIIYMRKDIEFEYVREEGRAIDFGSGRGNEGRNLCIDIDDDGTVIVTEGEVYINCEGNVINGCDWSYKTQRKPEVIICSVTDDFSKAIKKVATVEDYYQTQVA